MRLRKKGRSPTFKLETRSAVSSRVNVLIWSTICAILGFVGAAAAASVDSHRRLLGVRRAVYEVAMRREDGRAEPESCLAQRAAAWVGKDMAEIEVRNSKNNIKEIHLGGKRRQLDGDCERKASRDIRENLGVTCTDLT